MSKNSPDLGSCALVRVLFISVPSRVHSPHPDEDNGGDDARDDHGDGEDETDDVHVPLAVEGASRVSKADLEYPKSRN